MMMIISWDKDGVLLTEYLPCGITVNDPCYASIIERLRSVIVEKEHGKVSHGVLLLHDNASIHKFKFVQAAIRQAGFIELNHPIYSPEIAPSDSHLLSNLNKFLRLKNFSSDDEAVTTIEDYLTDLNSEIFCKGIQSLHGRWQRVKVSTFNKYDNCLSTVWQYISCTNFLDNLIFRHCVDFLLALEEPLKH